MRVGRYVHYVASFNGKRSSGVVDTLPGWTPIDVHDSIAATVCKSRRLSEMHEKDIVVEVMRVIE